MHLAKLLAASQGSFTYRVYATMRNLDKATQLRNEVASFVDKNLFIRQLDVCDQNSVDTLVKQVLAEQGRIDILVNNAGVGMSGIPEEIPMSQIKDNFETNFFGLVRLTTAVLPAMKKNDSGRIINLSSMGGINGVPFNDYYCAAKFAVEGYSESLAPVLRKFNIFLTLVEPGPILTAFSSNAQRHSQTEEPKAAEADASSSDPSVNKTRELFLLSRQKMIASFDPKQAETGEQVAEKIKVLLEEEKPALRFQSNPIYRELAKLKLVDPSGENAVNINVTRFLS
jgi:retinol dehydrogenase-8